MDKTITHYENWYIIFKDSELDYWLMKYLTPGFGHCYAVKESAGGMFWIIINSKNCYTEVRIESKLDYPHIRCLAPDSIILSIRAIIDTDRNRFTLCVFNCVEVCKSVLGIRDFWLWTPHQLYKRLVACQT